MKVILTETIESLGVIGSEVDVAKGFGRNYLLPQGKAIEATLANRKRMQQQKAKLDQQLAKEKAAAEDMAHRLSQAACTISAKVSEGEELYGSVAVRDIISALAQQQIEVDKRMVLLKEPIKKLGTYKIPVRVYKGMEPEITVEVVAE
jgi:large subunit ribosomal protein L9